MTKRKLFSVLIIAGLISTAAFFLLNRGGGFRYFSADCSVFKRNGDLIFSVPGELCVFHPDGRLLVAHQRDLTLYSQEQEVIWRIPNLFHHMLRLAADQQRVLGLSVEPYIKDGKKYRSDCVTIMELKTSQVLKKWCVNAHVAELQMLGFDMEPIAMRAPPVPLTSPSDYNSEISHTNSVFEVPPIPETPFETGGILVNLYLPSFAILLLDRDLTKIIWHKNMHEYQSAYTLHVHDVQVTEKGNLLAFVNLRFQLPRGQKVGFSQLLEFDPKTDAAIWQYADPEPEKFDARFWGNLNRLTNGNFLFSDTTNGSAAFEITPEGKKIWEFKTPFRDSNQKPTMFASVRPFEDLSFLKSRGLLE